MQATLVSFIIATYQRPQLLYDTVMNLRQLAPCPVVDTEVIVVDNDPQRSALPAFGQLQAACPPTMSLRYVHETRQGVSYARNRGIDEAGGDFLAFLDDDILVQPRWLAAVMDCFSRTGADCVGGRTLIKWEATPDGIVGDCQARLLATLDQGLDSFRMLGPEVPGGGNVAFRKSVLRDGRRFCTSLGPVGKSMLYGEDSELIRRLLKDGLVVWYCPEALGYHRTGGERLKPGYVIRQKYGHGISHAIIDVGMQGRLFQLKRAVARLGKIALIDTPRLLAAVVMRDPAQQLIARCSIAKQRGYLRGVLGAPAVAVEQSSALRNAWRRKHEQ